MNKVKMAIGDWSKDGHNQSENITFSVNKTVKEIQAAYLKSCKSLGVQFHHGKDATEQPPIKNGYANLRYMFTECEENSITQQIFDLLAVGGITVNDFDEYDEPNEEGEISYYIHKPLTLAKLIMKFIQYSLPDLIWKNDDDVIPFINGYWGDLNESFGYGIFSIY